MTKMSVKHINQFSVWWQHMTKLQCSVNCVRRNWCLLNAAAFTHWPFAVNASVDFRGIKHKVQTAIAVVAWSWSTVMMQKTTQYWWSVLSQTCYNFRLRKTVNSANIDGIRVTQPSHASQWRPTIGARLDSSKAEIIKSHQRPQK